MAKGKKAESLVSRLHPAESSEFSTAPRKVRLRLHYYDCAFESDGEPQEEVVDAVLVASSDIFPGECVSKDTPEHRWRYDGHMLLFAPTLHRRWKGEDGEIFAIPRVHSPESAEKSRFRSGAVILRKTGDEYAVGISVAPRYRLGDPGYDAMVGAMRTAQDASIK
jgi:hypothetical protein